MIKHFSNIILTFHDKYQWPGIGTSSCQVSFSRPPAHTDQSLLSTVFY